MFGSADGGGVLAPTAAPAAPQAPSEEMNQGPILGAWHGLGNLVKGVTGLVGTPIHDVGYGIAKLIPGEQSAGILNDQPGNSALTDDLIQNMTGVDIKSPLAPLDVLTMGALNTDRSKPGMFETPPIIGDYIHRYGGLVGVGGSPLSTLKQVWNNPVPFALDAVAVGGVASKAAGAAAESAIAADATGSAAAKAASVADDLIGAGTKAAPAQAAGLRAALEDIASTRQLNPFESIAAKVLPSSTVKLVEGRGLVPTAQVENPVSRAMLSPIRKLVTEPVSALEDRTAAQVAQVGTEIENWRGVQRPTMASLDQLQGLVDQAHNAGLVRIEKPQMAHFSAWREAIKFDAKMRGQALGHRLSAQRVQVGEIVPIIKENPELAKTGDLTIQGLDITIPGLEPAPWFNREIPAARVLEPAQVPVSVGGGGTATDTAASFGDTIDPAHFADLQAADEAFATRTETAVGHVQRFIDDVQSNPAFAEGGMDVPAEVDAARRLIRSAYDGLERHADFARGGEVTPATRLADTMRLQELESVAEGFNGVGLTPKQVFDRAYMPLRRKYGANPIEVPEGGVGWEGGPSPTELDDALHSSGAAAPTYFPHIDETRLSPSDFFASKKQVGAVSAARDPHMQATRGILLERNTYLKDPIEVLKRASARAVREEETYRLWTSMTERFGTPVAHDADIPAGYVAIAPDALRLNYRSRMIMMDRVDTMMSQGIARDDAIARATQDVLTANHADIEALRASGQVKTYAVPKVVADRLTDAARYAQVTGNKVIQLAWDKPMQAWRSITLFGSPRFILNNTIGNTAFALMQGVKLMDVVKIFDEKFRVMSRNWMERRAGLPETTMTREGSLAGQVQKLPTYDDLGSGFVGNTVEQYSPQLSAEAANSKLGRLYERIGGSKPVQIMSNAKQAYAHLNTIVEDSFREASFLTEAERSVGISTVKRTGRVFMDSEKRIDDIMAKGFTEAKGAASVEGANSFFGNYGNMTPFERHVIRRFIFPFWGFYRHQLSLLVRFPFEHPLRAEVIAQMGRAHDDMLKQYGPMPSWLDNSLPLGAPGDVSEFYNPRGADPFAGSFQPPVSQINPILKMLMERGTGRDSFTGQPFTDPNVITPFGSDQPFEVVRDDQGNVIGTKPLPDDATVLPSILEQIASSTPLYNNVKEAIAGGKTYDTSTLLDALQGNALALKSSGEPVREYSPGDAIARYLGIGTTTTDLTAYQERMAELQAAALKVAQQRQAVTA